MSLTVNRISRDEIRSRRDSLMADLYARLQEDLELSGQDLSDLEALGLFSVDEQRTLDEIRRLDFLLGH